MKQLPGPGDTNACPECRSLNCTCGTAEPSPVPDFNLELSYAIEKFEDENDRQPTEEELKPIKAEVQEKVDSASEAYGEWKALGLFECEVCGKMHRHHAPPACCRAFNADR